MESIMRQFAKEMATFIKMQELVQSAAALDTAISLSLA